MAKILMADDNPDTCLAVRTRLEARGHMVHAFQRVEESIRALEVATANREPYEVAIIDLVFDNYRGPTPKEKAGMRILEAAIKVRFLEPIILTAHGSVPTAQEALEKGVFRFVTKATTRQGDLSFFNHLGEVVDLAVGTREVYRELDERLSGLREFLNELLQDRSEPRTN